MGCKKYILLGLIVLFLIAVANNVFAALTDDILVYYSFDNSDISGNTVNDLFLPAYDATNNGSTTGVAGKLNEAFDFDGSNDNILIPTTDTFDMDSNFSITAWVKRETDNTLDTIYNIGGYQEGGRDKFVDFIIHSNDYLTLEKSRAYANFPVWIKHLKVSGNQMP